MYRYAKYKEQQNMQIQCMGKLMLSVYLKSYLYLRSFLFVLQFDSSINQIHISTLEIQEIKYFTSKRRIHLFHV